MRAAYQWMLLLAMAVAVGQAGRIAIWGPASDSSHPDFADLSNQFQQARSTFDKRFEQGRNAFAKVDDPPVIDLATVNRGRWKTACLFGGYTDPIDAMAKHGAAISIRDRLRFEWPFLWLGLFAVKEYSMMVAFIDDGNRANFIYFRRAIGAETQHLRQCVTQPNTKLIPQD